ncbi:hypothetical protein [Massilia luteola]|uniref:hypothetical protein n=1 Tax=Massilia luteola TaxID=3081751 RepID=UPI002ACC2A16|nr:hypothetical protein [Massilia sp. Gc5]
MFIDIVGTSETDNNAAAMAAVDDMVAQGYVAATVDYAPSRFGTSSVLGAKSSCMCNPNSALSTVSQLCSRATAGCSKGIVASGFSQGSILALLAKNDDARVQGLRHGHDQRLCDVRSVDLRVERQPHTAQRSPARRRRRAGQFRWRRAVGRRPGCRTSRGRHALPGPMPA